MRRILRASFVGSQLGGFEYLDLYVVVCGDLQEMRCAFTNIQHMFVCFVEGLISSAQEGMHALVVWLLDGRNLHKSCPSTSRLKTNATCVIGELPFIPIFRV